MIRRLVALAVAAAALGLLPAAAQAHALLEGTVPERGVALDTAPREVVLRFSEPVETALGAVRVYDAGATRCSPARRGTSAARAMWSRSGCATACPTAATR